MKRMLALDAILAAPWAIKPEYLKTITDIAQRAGEDPKTLEARLGRPLERASRATTRDGVVRINKRETIFTVTTGAIPEGFPCLGLSETCRHEILPESGRDPGPVLIVKLPETVWQRLAAVAI